MQCEALNTSWSPSSKCSDLAQKLTTLVAGEGDGEGPPGWAGVPRLLTGCISRRGCRHIVEGTRIHRIGSGQTLQHGACACTRVYARAGHSGPEEVSGVARPMPEECHALASHAWRANFEGHSSLRLCHAWNTRRPQRRHHVGGCVDVERVYTLHTGSSPQKPNEVLTGRQLNLILWK